MAAALDRRSFILGMVTAFCECIAGGCKRMALSPPLTADDYAQVAAEAGELIELHGLLHYHEQNLDEPPERRFEWIVIAGQPWVLAQYQALRAAGCRPAQSLAPFSELLSYRPEEAIHTGYDAFRALFPEQAAGQTRGEG